MRLLRLLLPASFLTEVQECTAHLGHIVDVLTRSTDCVKDVVVEGCVRERAATEGGRKGGGHVRNLGTECSLPLAEHYHTTTELVATLHYI